MSVPVWVWVATLAAILAMLAADMLAHRAARGSTTALALRWSAVWVGLGAGFGAVVWAAWGPEPAGEYYAGYLLEKSLSVDNVLLFALIFAAFAVPRAYQHRVLFLGVLGALALRAGMIAAGAALLSRFAWVTYVFGAFLLVTALRMVRPHGDQSAQRSSRLIRRVIPTTDGYHGERFWVRQAGRLTATPLLIVLVLIEISDVIFAVDSIPAVFSVTREPFLVFTANAFAILGLRSLYFLLDGLMSRLVYLRTGLAVILCFVGLKMLLAGVIHIPVAVSLAVIAACLAVTTWASLRATHHRKAPSHSTVDRPLDSIVSKL
jgi:tellurite resistance protein TerC